MVHIRAVGEFLALAPCRARAEKIPCDDPDKRDQQDQRPEAKTDKARSGIVDGHESPDVYRPSCDHDNTKILHHFSGPSRWG